MPRIDQAEITPEPEPEPEEGQLTERQRRQLTREGALNRGNRWAVYSVGQISYTPPEAVRTTVEKVKAGELVIDPRYNREVKYVWVEEIEDAYNPDQLQVLNISRRLYRKGKSGEEERVYDGDVAKADRVELVVISGQHRLVGTLNKKGADFLLWCQIFDGLTDQIESELYALFDEKIRPHQPYDRHRAHVFGTNPEAVEIDEIVKAIGLEVYIGKQPGAKDGVIYAVSTLYAIYRSRNMGPEFLKRLLGIHYGAWGDLHDGYTASMLSATSIILRRYGWHSHWQDEWLIQALSDPAHNPQTLLMRARASAVGVPGTSIAQEAARIEHAWYVSGKKGYNRLLPWNATKEQIEEHSRMAERNKTVRRRRTVVDLPEEEEEEGGEEGGEDESDS